MFIHKEEKGSALIISLVITAVIAMLLTAFSTFIVREFAATTRTEDGMLALQIAEAGVNRAVWKLQQGTNWDNWTPDGDGDPNDAITDTFSELEGTYAIKVETVTGDTSNLKRIVTVTGTYNNSSRGVEVKVIKIIDIVFNHGLYSKGDSDVSSNPNFNWSDIYSEGAMSFQNETKIPAEGTVDFYSMADFYIGDPSGGDVVVYADHTNLHPNETTFPARPELDYETFKSLSKSMDTGYYFRPQMSSGSWTGNFIDNGGTVITDIGAAMEAARAADGDDALIFIDTTDGQPFTYTDSDSDGKFDEGETNNGVSIQISGNTYTQGTVIINGSISFNGTGSGDLQDVVDDQGNTVDLDKVTHNGIMYVEGSFSGGGTVTMYGAITAGCYSGNGTPNVYYNVNLANRKIINTLNDVEIYSWRETRTL